ncbi:hypothetical protein KCU65_g8073, partial [Aureobasidium melanogenum]
MNRTDISHPTEVGSKQGDDSRPEAEIDIEKQCAVPLPSGAQCARGLNCKRHGTSAKRAVTGRSAPFDQLLATYQRDIQARSPACRGVQPGIRTLQCRTCGQSRDEHKALEFELYPQDDFDQEIIFDKEIIFDQKVFFDQEIVLHREEYCKDNFEDRGQGPDHEGSVDIHLLVQEAHFNIELQEDLLVVSHQAQHCRQGCDLFFEDLKQ